MSNQKLESALAELKKFREVMELEDYAEIEHLIIDKLGKFCKCKSEDLEPCLNLYCDTCQKCGKLLTDE